MHAEMWRNAATRANIVTVRSRGIHLVGPADGELAGGDSGPGRMAEPEQIFEAAIALLGPRDLDGMSVAVSAGGTREPIDPVRFLGNRSSGRQGVALAAAARARGADVTLIAAHLEVSPPEGVTLVEASTARELQQAVTDAAPDAEILVMAAAVADYRPAVVVDSKIKKEAQGDTLELSLVKNPDILAELGAARRAGEYPGLRLVGFAAETEPDPAALLELGRAKIARKGADLLVVNRVGWTEGFATDGNSVVVLDGAGDIVSEAAGSKMSVADRILDAIVALD
jgi:phosphopantothenoylcysteine decarboxylase/phosphopantothenate--cysteine ligase